MSGRPRPAARVAAAVGIIVGAWAAAFLLVLACCEIARVISR